MPNFYSDQLNAIHIMLLDPSPEIVSEGYDLLFKLWLENIDTPDFTKDLMLLATQQNDLIQEFETRLNTLVLRDSITSQYLRKQFRAFVSEYMLTYSHQTKITSDDINNAKSVLTQKNNNFISQTNKYTGIGALLFGIAALLLGLSTWISWDTGLILGLIGLIISLLLFIVKSE